MKKKTQQETREIKSSEDPLQTIGDTAFILLWKGPSTLAYLPECLCHKDGSQ